MDLSKVFDCVPHDLLIAKLEAFGINENLLASYLSYRKQCVHINNVTRDFEIIISGVPQGSIVGLILFNCILMTSFILLKKQAFTILR